MLICCIKSINFLDYSTSTRQGKWRFSWVQILHFQQEKQELAKSRYLNVAVCWWFVFSSFIAKLYKKIQIITPSDLFHWKISLSLATSTVMNETFFSIFFCFAQLCMFDFFNPLYHCKAPFAAPCDYDSIKPSQD